MIYHVFYWYGVCYGHISGSIGEVKGHYQGRQGHRSLPMSRSKVKVICNDMARGATGDYIPRSTPEGSAFFIICHVFPFHSQVMRGGMLRTHFRVDRRGQRSLPRSARSKVIANVKVKGRGHWQ